MRDSENDLVRSEETEMNNHGCFPLCQRFRKFRSEFKWKSSFRFLLTVIFGITSGGGPHISVGIFPTEILRSILTNRFFALTRVFSSHFYWLARFNWKMSFHFPQVIPLISDQSVCPNGTHPMIPCSRVAMTIDQSELRVFNLVAITVFWKPWRSPKQGSTFLRALYSLKSNWSSHFYGKWWIWCC